MHEQVLFLLVGYVLTVAIEMPILLLGLARSHPVRRRLFAGFWLTACTYPVVVLVLPPLLWTSPWGSRPLYLCVAETFAPLAECGLFFLAFDRISRRDALAIVAANLASFGLAEGMRILFS